MGFRNLGAHNEFCGEEQVVKYLSFFIYKLIHPEIPIEEINQTCQNQASFPSTLVNSGD